MHAVSEALDAVNGDAISECSSLEAEMGLGVQIQMATILAFAYIWSIGAFIPYRSVHYNTSLLLDALFNM